MGTSNVVRLAQYGVGQQLHAGDVIERQIEGVSADHEALRDLCCLGKPRPTKYSVWFCLWDKTSGA